MGAIRGYDGDSRGGRPPRRPLYPIPGGLMRGQDSELMTRGTVWVGKVQSRGGREKVVCQRRNARKGDHKDKETNRNGKTNRQPNYRITWTTEAKSEPRMQSRGRGRRRTTDGQRQKSDEFPNWVEMMFFSALRRAARA